MSKEKVVFRKHNMEKIKVQYQIKLVTTNADCSNIGVFI